MSVSLLISPRQDGAAGVSRIVPIATQDFFRSHWMPIADALGLHWVRQFDTGVGIGNHDLRDVIDELERLRDSCGTAGDSGNLILERLEALINELRALQNNGHEDVEIFIG